MKLWRSVAVFPGLVSFLLMAGCVSVERKPPPQGGVAAGTVAAESAATPSTGQSAAKAPAHIPAAAPEQARKKENVAPLSAKPAAAPLDLKSLEKRLRETEAIGVFTKLTLKNQVDDLLEEFRALHQGRPKPTLAELRQPYELLLLKVLSLLQDGDPPLARAIVASREAIWGILADKTKFNSLS